MEYQLTSWEEVLNVQNVPPTVISAIPLLEVVDISREMSEIDIRNHHVNHHDQHISQHDVSVNNEQGPKPCPFPFSAYAYASLRHAF